ncbi:C25 family cysteine peptidase [Dokdonella sp. MW10]|uniref:C25 family cysteine peptidase n=1 Tax=Dokdonella sp. MW10 TaxID=2992926 RepID=UPI003F7EF6E5
MKKILPTLAALAALLPLTPAWSCDGALHVEIEHTGVYSIDHAAIVAQQPALDGCDVSRLYMSKAGEEIPIRVVDDGSGRLGKGTRIEWIGEQLHGKESWFNPFSVNNVYLLSAGPGDHLRMRDAVPGSTGGSTPLARVLHYEQENLMIRLDQSQQEPGDEPDVWQWAKLTHADPEPFSFTFDLPDLKPGKQATTVTLTFRGLSRSPRSFEHEKPADHAVDVSLNDGPSRRVEWEGRDEHAHELVIPASELRARGNTLRLSVPKRELPWDKRNPLVDVVMFNSAQFQFAIEGDIGQAALPFVTAGEARTPIDVRWSGAESLVLYGKDGVRRPGQAAGPGRVRFAGADKGVDLLPALADRISPPVKIRPVATNRWDKPTVGADYLIVTHSTLRGAIEPLAAFHEQRGLKVDVIDVEDVYDHFNHGVTHPQAIRNLMEHAYAAWPEPKPRFLLLVGDASFDIRNNTENDLRYAKFANNMHELAYSGHFAGIPGTSYGADAPKFAGRNLIPTWQYPSSEGQSASDNPYGIIGEGYHPTVAVGRFPVVTPDEVAGIVEKTISYVTTPQLGNWRRDVMFITDESDHFKKASNDIADTIGSEGFVADRIYASASEADNLAHQSAIKDGINEGQLLVHFLGHGGRYIWRTGPPDIRKNHDLFTLDDVSNLTNHGKLPMILSMTCYSAPFDNPSEDSIGERFLRERDKGAVAVFAASWRNAPSTNYSKALVSELLTPGATIGEGIVRAKKSINDRTLVEMYNLLGDPALVLERPRDRARVVIDDSRWTPGLLVSLPGNGFQGRIDIDWLDADGAKIASSSHTSNEARFRVPMPALAEGKHAHSVRVYAADLRSGRDASAGVNLDDIRVAPAASRWAWLDWFVPKREAAEASPAAVHEVALPFVADRLSSAGFEHAPQPDTKLVAGN